MLVGNEVRRDPRVTKEAKTLVDAGYSVTVVGLGSGTGVTGMTADGYRIRLLPWENRSKSLPPSLRGIAEHSSRVLRDSYRRMIGRADGRRGAAAELGSSPADRLALQLESLERRLSRHGSQNRWMGAMAVAAAPRVIHAQDLDTLEAGVIAARATGAALVFDAHEIWWQQYAEGEAPKEWVEFYRELERALIGRVDRVITVCDSIADFFVERYGIERPLVLRNTIDAPSGGFLLERDLHPVNSPVEVLFHGRYAPNRGLEELVQATRFFSNAVLVLRGSGELEPELRGLVEREGLRGKIRFDAPVPMKNVVQAAAQHDIGVIPYKPVCLNNRFSTPNKLFEYLNAGIAIAASDLPEIRRIVEGESAGLLFDPYSPQSIAEAVNRLTADPAALAAMRLRALRAASGAFHWREDAGRLIGLYRSLLPRPLMQSVLRIVTGRGRLAR